MPLSADLLWDNSIILVLQIPLRVFRVFVVKLAPGLAVNSRTHPPDTVIPRSATASFTIPTISQRSGGSAFSVMREHTFFVYIMASKSRVLYTGISNDLPVRVFQHKTGRCDGFTKQYRVHRLVYFESFQYVRGAIAREGD